MPATKAILDDDGSEILDDTPIAVPLGFQIPESLNDQVRRLVKHHRFNEAMGGDSALDTFEEADDFDVGDDFDPASPYEVVFDPILNRDVTAADFLANQAKYRAAYKAAMPEEMPAPPTPVVDPPKADPLTDLPGDE